MSNQNDLAHYGVMGMKWGRRMATNAAKGLQKDVDSLRKHGYNDEADAIKKMADKNRAKAKDLDRKIKAKEQDNQIKKDRRKDVQNRRRMSDKDLIEKIARLEKEKKLRELTDAEINPGRKATNDILKAAGSKAATAMVAGGMLYAVKATMTGKVDVADMAGYIAPKPGKK